MADVQKKQKKKQKQNPFSVVSNDREFPFSRLQVEGRRPPESHFAK